MKTAIDQILEPYKEGKSVIIQSGRDLFDLDVNTNGQLTPLIEILRERALKEHDLVTIEYSLSSGVTFDLTGLTEAEKENVRKKLNESGINAPGHGGGPENVRIIRSLIRLSQTSGKPELHQGKPFKFLVIFHFSEHMTPQLQTGTHSPEQLLSIETVLKLSKSLGVRKSGNYVMFSEARPGTLDALIYQNVPVINLRQPGVDEKSGFVQALHARYSKATLCSPLSDQVITNLSAGTPNRSLESLFLASEKTGSAITSHQVFEKKQQDIISLSENTLEAVDASRVQNQQLVGRTIQRPIEILKMVAENLKTNSKTSLRNILLCGAPSTGKTMLAVQVATQADVPAFNMNTPKNQYVGESERITKRMFNTMREQGGFGIIDEVELILPMDRSQSTGDSGVTQNIQGQLQTFLSDPSLSGKVALIGTSNRPNSISEAMRQRWTIVPVLMPIAEDFPAIILSIAKTLNPEFDVELNNHAFMEAAKLFYEAGAAPREIREALICSLATYPGALSLQHIVFACWDIIPNSNPVASVFSDYCALAYCRNNSFLPWWDNTQNCPDANYPFPAYIREILNDNLTINQEKLRKRLNELAPLANV